MQILYRCPQKNNNNNHINHLFCSEKFVCVGKSMWVHITYAADLLKKEEINERGDHNRRKPTFSCQYTSVLHTSILSFSNPASHTRILAQCSSTLMGTFLLHPQHLPYIYLSFLQDTKPPSSVVVQMGK